MEMLCRRKTIKLLLKNHRKLTPMKSQRRPKLKKRRKLRLRLRVKLKPKPGVKRLIRAVFHLKLSQTQTMLSLMSLLMALMKRLSHLPETSVLLVKLMLIQDRNGTNTRELTQLLQCQQRLTQQLLPTPPLQPFDFVSNI